MANRDDPAEQVKFWLKLDPHHFELAVQSLVGRLVPSSRQERAVLAALASSSEDKIEAIPRLACVISIEQMNGTGYAVSTY